MTGSRKYTLIGDIVDSRKADDRAALQRGISRVLQRANQDSQLRHSRDLGHGLEVTTGDEFQGVFDDLVSAIRASLTLRLDLLDDGGVDSRYGIGLGEIQVFDSDRTPVNQDGTGWWAARRSIDRAKAAAGSKRTSSLRTAYSEWSDAGQIPDDVEKSINAFLVMRDDSVTRMKPRERRLLRGLLAGVPQDALASQEGITQSAVSQNLSSSGAFVIEAAQSRLTGALV